MPGEPIVVLHVALTKDIPSTIASVVKHHRMVKRFSVEAMHTQSGAKEGEDPSWCQSAIFYSITSTQVFELSIAHNSDFHMSNVNYI